MGPQPQVTLSYTYDALDRRLTISDSLGGTTRYAYDVEDRLTKLTAPWGTAYSFGYDGEGRRTSLTSTSGRNSTYGYTNGLLSALKHVQSGVTLTDMAYDYGPDGQLKAILDRVDPAKSRFISYDALNRLVQVSKGVPPASGGVPVPVEDYAYDEEGNRTSSHLSATYSSNDHNQLLEDAKYTYGYDVKGNRISRTAKVGGKVETYTYDSQNRLIGYTNGTTKASYAYDALDRRIAKLVSNASDNVEIAYVYNVMEDEFDLGNDDILMEFTVDKPSSLKRCWLHSPKIDEPIAYEEYINISGAGNGVERALLADKQGSVLHVVDTATNSLEAEYRYEGFGLINQTHGSLKQPYGYTGREYDLESGLYHYRARAFDPLTGKFLQPDPIGFGGGDANLYAYAFQNPFNLADPSGETSVGSATLTAGTALGGVGAVGVVSNGVFTGGVRSILRGMGLAGALMMSSSTPQDDEGEEEREAACWAAYMARMRVNHLTWKSCQNRAIANLRGRKRRWAIENCNRARDAMDAEAFEEYLFVMVQKSLVNEWADLEHMRKRLFLESVERINDSCGHNEIELSGFFLEFLNTLRIVDLIAMQVSEKDIDRADRVALISYSLLTKNQDVFLKNIFHLIGPDFENFDLYKSKIVEYTLIFPEKNEVDEPLRNAIGP